MLTSCATLGARVLLQPARKKLGCPLPFPTDARLSHKRARLCPTTCWSAEPTRISRIGELETLASRHPVLLACQTHSSGELVASTLGATIAARRHHPACQIAHPDFTNCTATVLESWKAGLIRSPSCDLEQASGLLASRAVARQALQLRSGAVCEIWTGDLVGRKALASHNGHPQSRGCQFSAGVGPASEGRRAAVHEALQLLSSGICEIQVGSALQQMTGQGHTCL